MAKLASRFSEFFDTALKHIGFSDYEEAESIDPEPVEFVRRAPVAHSDNRERRAAKQRIPMPPKTGRQKIRAFISSEYGFWTYIGFAGIVYSIFCKANGIYPLRRTELISIKELILLVVLMLPIFLLPLWFHLKAKRRDKNI